MNRIEFRFDADRHLYIERATGVILPHITGMLKSAGLVDDQWFTEESSLRGTAVHKLTADYDLEALDVASCVSRFRPYLLGYVRAVGILQPEILEVEEPRVHARHRYGGRPDRVVRMRRKLGVLEVKTGMRSKAHPVQTALQTILVAPDYDLPPEMLDRHCLYLKPNGKFSLEEHGSRSDFDRARAIIREYATP